MITPQTDKKYTVVHAFSGSGGCSSGFDEEGFETLAALDFDADACADLDYLLNRKVAVVVDIEKMEPVDMRRIVGDRRPDVYVATPPCKGWSRLLGKGRRMSDKYVRMCSGRSGTCSTSARTTSASWATWRSRRERCLFVARDPKRCPAFLMVPDSSIRCGPAGTSSGSSRRRRSTRRASRCTSSLSSRR
jgi:hypothetical protein